MTVGVLAQGWASFIYLLPAVVTLFWLAWRRAVLAEAALWVPAALAIDLLGSLLLARAVPLSLSLIIMRAGWMALLGWLFYARGARLKLPSRNGWHQIALVGAVSAMSFAFSASISRPSSIWDRQFHIPLVSMLGGQRLPFLTVFQPNSILHFHFAGDVVAVALRTFSGGRIHASLAIALAHDLMFFLIGGTVATLLARFSSRKSWIFPAVMAIFLSGPFAIQRANLGALLAGYSYLNLLCMSYRPSIVVTMLFLVGAFAALWNQTLGPGISKRSFAAIVLADVAVLGISDEPTAALFGVAMAVVWVVDPMSIFANRRVGVLVLLGVVAAILAPNLLFQAALVPGGPVQNVRLVPFREPGFSEPSLSLGSHLGVYALLSDLAPFLLVSIGSLGLAWRRATRAAWAVSLSLFVVLLVATFALTTLDFNGMAIENHRFLTFCEIVFPVAGVLMLAGLPAGCWERVPIIGALLIAAVSTFYWYQHGVGPGEAYFTNDVDCRLSADARLFETPKPTYVPFESLYAFSGCRAIFFPGSPNANSWSGVLFNGYPTGGRAAFEALDRGFVRPDQSLQVACPVHMSQSDPACAYAREKHLCKSAGTGFETCQLSGEHRRRVLASPWGP